MRQERAGSPSTSTVHAPQTPCSQPRCVPVSRRSSRRKSASVLRASPRRSKAGRSRSSRCADARSCHAPRSRDSLRQRPSHEDGGHRAPVRATGVQIGHRGQVARPPRRLPPRCVWGGRRPAQPRLGRALARTGRSATLISASRASPMTSPAIVTDAATATIAKSPWRLAISCTDTPVPAGTVGNRTLESTSSGSSVVVK